MIIYHTKYWAIITLCINLLISISTISLAQESTYYGRSLTLEYQSPQTYIYRIQEVWKKSAINLIQIPYSSDGTVINNQRSTQYETDPFVITETMGTIKFTPKPQHSIYIQGPRKFIDFNNVKGPMISPPDGGLSYVLSHRYLRGHINTSIINSSPTVCWRGTQLPICKYKGKLPPVLHAEIGQLFSLPLSNYITDINSGDSLTYQLANNDDVGQSPALPFKNPSKDLLSIDGDTGLMLFKIPDHTIISTGSAYELAFTVTDNKGGITSLELVVFVTDINN